MEVIKISVKKFMDLETASLKDSIHLEKFKESIPDEYKKSEDVFVYIKNSCLHRVDEVDQTQ